MVATPDLWWRRLIYSVLSLLAGVGTFGICITIQGGFTDHATKGALGMGFLWWCVVGSIFAAPGWLLALPLVFAWSHIQGRRFWIVCATGLLIAPLALVLLALVGELRDGRHTNHATDLLALSGFLPVALPLAAVSTLSYLALMHHGTPKSAASKSITGK